MKGKFEFNVDGLILPEDYLQQACSKIRSATKDYVVPKVSRYSGRIYSVYDKSTVMDFRASFGEGKLKEDIQDSLGNRNKESTKKYEFVIGAKVLKSYSFRVLFLEHGLGGYPVNVVVEKGISDEINVGDSDSYVYKCENFEVFKKLIDQILSSDYMHKLMQGVITESLLAEKIKNNTEL